MLVLEFKEIRHGEETFVFGGKFCCYYGTQGKTLPRFGAVVNGDFVHFGFVFNGMDAGYFALAQCFYGYGVGGRLLVELPLAFAVEVFDEADRKSTRLNS